MISEPLTASRTALGYGAGMSDGRPLPERLKRLRHARHLTLKDVATALGLAVPSVHAWESGKARPDIERLPDLARLYGVTLAELITGTAEPGPSAREIAALFVTLSPADQATVRALIERLAAPARSPTVYPAAEEDGQTLHDRLPGASR